MHDSRPYRRRQARAIAISQAVETQRKALVARVALVLASAALTLQALMLAHGYLAASHP